eukprot:166214-Pelagomonas_calceolata.AAC.1
MRKWIPAGACSRDPSISYVISGSACLMICNSICTFATSNASMSFYFVGTNIALQTYNYDSSYHPSGFWWGVPCCALPY